MVGWSTFQSSGFAGTTSTEAYDGSQSFTLRAPGSPRLDQVVTLPAGTTRVRIGGYFKAVGVQNAGSCKVRGQITSGDHSGWKLSIEWGPAESLWTYLSDTFVGLSGLPELKVRGQVTNEDSPAACFLDNLEVFVVQLAPPGPPPSAASPLPATLPPPAVAAPPPAVASPPTNHQNGNCSNACMLATCANVSTLPCGALTSLGCSCEGCCDSLFAYTPPDFCGQGTAWSPASQSCVRDCSADRRQLGSDQQEGRWSLAQGNTPVVLSREQHFRLPVSP